MYPPLCARQTPRAWRAWAGPDRGASSACALSLAQGARLALSALLVVALSPRSAAADIIHLRTGATIEADGCRRMGDELRCQRAGGAIGIPLIDVERFEKRAPGAAPPRRVAVAPVAPAAVGTSSTAAGSSAPILSGGGLTAEAAQARLTALEDLARRPGQQEAGLAREMALLLTFLGNEASRRGDDAAAERSYAAALARDPGLAVARLNHAATLINLNRPAAAIAQLRSLPPGNPLEAEALDLLGQALSADGQVDEAIEAWERSIALHPSSDLRERIDRARRLRGAAEGFNRSTAAHFELAFDGQEISGPLSGQILAYLEEAWSSLSSRLNHYPDAAIRVTLYPNRAFHEATAAPEYAKKSCESGAAPDDGAPSGSGRAVFAAGGVSVSPAGALDLQLSRARADREGNAVKATAVGLVGRTSALRVSADRGIAAPGRLAGGQAADPTTAACGRITRAPEQTQAGPAWRIHWLADDGDAPESCVDVGLHRGRDRARWRPADADHLG